MVVRSFKSHDGIVNNYAENIPFIPSSVTGLVLALGAMVDGTNDASNYWQARLLKRTPDGQDCTELCVLNTSAIAPGAFRSVTAQAQNADLSNAAALHLELTKVGSPGALYGGGLVQYE